jgi:hypothetical protein
VVANRIVNVNNHAVNIGPPGAVKYLMPVNDGDGASRPAFSAGFEASWSASPIRGGDPGDFVG